MQVSSIINIPHYFVTISRLHKMQVDEPCAFFSEVLFSINI